MNFKFDTKVKFDTEALLRQATEVARNKIFNLLEESKREMGVDGAGIHFDKASILRHHGDKVDLGKATFPSEEVKERFMGIFNRRMKRS